VRTKLNFNELKLPDKFRFKSYHRFTIQEWKFLRNFISINNSYNKFELLSFLGVKRSTYYRLLKKFDKEENLNKKDGKPQIIYKYQLQEYKDLVFSILHSPPKDYGFNRTTWRMSDLHKIMNKMGKGISLLYIRKIIKEAGYRYLKARKVLTSNDPNYREKLNKIQSILSQLKVKEKFFSIDEYGPFSVKEKGGKRLVKKDEYPTFPQFQKSKGWLIITTALELSSNQITYFYSRKKDTEETLYLIELLLIKYSKEDRLYLSWDAASWHSSKELNEFIEVNNQDKGKPEIRLVPLPAGAQFLNVIESIFSGMSRAIIHNSDYKDLEDCKSAIDTYFFERNEHFIKNPKKAGNKIWGKEREKSRFKSSNNCKDPCYR